MCSPPAAAGGGDGGDSSSAGREDQGPDPIVISNLRAYPSAGGVELRWTNPANVTIAAYNLTITPASGNAAENSGFSDTSSVSAVSVEGGEARQVRSAGFSPALALTDGNRYRFSLRLVLDGTDANRTTRAVAVNDERNVLIGPNLDGDEYADADELETDTDGDNVTNAADWCPRTSAANRTGNTDSDGDGCWGDANAGGEDAFPSDPAEGVDSDGDGTGDNADNCPLVANVQLASGSAPTCMDIDGDRYLDSQDNCPSVANSEQYNNDTDGLGDACDADDDGDGIADSEDFCPLSMIAGGFVSDADTDADGDGCHDTAGGAGGEAEDSHPGDSDNDDTMNAVDVDDDGDGLIEINTTAQLNAVRHNLAGTGLDMTNSDNNNASGGDATGCAHTFAGVRQDQCRGYELTANLDLQGINWRPIGTCFNPSCSNRDEEKFHGVFNGNGRIISNITVDTSDLPIFRSEEVSGVGFFGAINASVELRNINLVNLNISSSVQYAGGLAGWASGATFTANSVIATAINGGNRVGGLVGDGQGASLSSNSVVAGRITASSTLSSAGGLVGAAPNAIISSNSVVAGSIIGGTPEDLGIGVGGLVGSGDAFIIHSNYVTAGSIDGDDAVGGLAGEALSSSQINSSYALARVIRLGRHVGFTRYGGVVGSTQGGEDPTTDSYWNVTGDTSFSRGSDFGTPQSQNALRAGDGQGAGDIYADWVNAWCNPATGAFTTDETVAAAGDYANNRAWDFGTANDYPALSCVPLTAYQQREYGRRALDASTPFSIFPLVPPTAPAN